MLQGIECVTREHHLNLVISSTQGEPAPKKGYQRIIGPTNTDGLLVFADVLSDQELTYLFENQFPVVLMHQNPPAGVPIPMVTVENKKSATLLVEHLIQVHGCRRIAYLQGGENQEDSHWRELGYREALDAYGLPFDPALVRGSGLDTNQASNAVKEWLALPEPIDAIFAFDDEKAHTLIYFLQQAGKRVPGDIAVVGFDDLSFSNIPPNPLTAVRTPIVAVGETAAKQLVRLIHGEQIEEKILLPTELIIRQTCGCSNSSLDHTQNHFRESSFSTQQEVRQPIIAVFPSHFSSRQTIQHYLEETMMKHKMSSLWVVLAVAAMVLSACAPAATPTPAPAPQQSQPTAVPQAPEATTAPAHAEPTATTAPEAASPPVRRSP